MKHNLTYLLTVLSFTIGFIVLSSCKKDRNTLPIIKTTSVSSVTQVSATSGGQITDDGGADVSSRGICWNISGNPKTGDSKTSDGSGTGTFTSQLVNLTPNTTYYIRAFATNEVGTSYGNEVSFSTKNIELPNVTTSPITSITQFSAISGGNIESDNGGHVTERGVCWDNKSDPDITKNRTSDGTGIGTFISSMKNLQQSVKYYVKAYAVNSVGTAYGNELNFTTPGSIPNVATIAVSAITAHSAETGGTIISDGGTAISAKGVCWSLTSSPTVNDDKTIDGSGSEGFKSTISGLSAGKTYYVRAYAANSIGTAYGNEHTFKTLADIPKLTTTSVSNITATTSLSGGNVTDDCGSPIFSKGVCWSTRQGPVADGPHTNDGTGTGSFTSQITGLAPNTIYYIRAYARNNVGTAYGNEHTFTTRNIELPVLTTVSASAITTSSAVSGGNISSDGGDNITARGVCWSVNQDPTIAGNKTIDGSGTGVFASIISSLNPNTTYYVRAYATNRAGTSYGNGISFKTQTPPKSQIIADHNIVNDFDKIPPYYMAEIKKMMVSFTGESHANAYRHGMTLLKGLYPDYASSVNVAEPYTDKYLRVDNSGFIGEEEWFTWYPYPVGSRPSESNIIKNLISSYATAGHPIHALGFSWCWDHTNGDPSISVDPVYGIRWYGVSIGGPDGSRCWGLDGADYSLTGNRVSMESYFFATLDYIDYCKTNNYPTRIIFTTCPVDELYSGERGYQGHLKQEYIRSFVKADTSRILFDYADILCYDDDGKQTTTTWNGHVYPAITPTNLGDGSIGHIGEVGAIRLAKAQWWLLARIAGWDGE